MCCNNNNREIWVIRLTLLGIIISLAVSIPMILITYPEDACLLFVSVRGEALIYGHPAGCRFITGSHFLVMIACLILGGMLFSLRWRSSRNNQQSTSVSNKSLRGSVGRVSRSSNINSVKPKVSLMLFSLVIMLFTAITAIIILSGYLVTCGELQYETRRKVHDSVPLGIPYNNIYITCPSLFRDTDFQNRFHFDHYELAGQWHGQYTAYRHGRPQVWTGGREPLMDIPTGLEISLVGCWISWAVWTVILLLTVLHTRSAKRKIKEEIAESLEDEKIWATDMELIHPKPTSHQYEASHLSREYEIVNRTENNFNTAYNDVPGPPSDASDVDTLLAHQRVIANTHPEGSFFMTSNGTYVQLVNGVLTNVDVQPIKSQEQLLYSELQFDQPNPTVQNVPPHHQLLQSLNSNTPTVRSTRTSLPHTQNNAQSPEGSVTSSQLSQAATVSHMSQSSYRDEGEHSGDWGGDNVPNTKTDMKKQKEIAALAGIKCSQF